MKKLLILLFSILISFNSYGETGCSAKYYERNILKSTIFLNTFYFQPEQTEQNHIPVRQKVCTIAPQFYNLAEHHLLCDTSDLDYIGQPDPDGTFYLPNQSEPYSGEDLCVYKDASGQYFLKGIIKNGKKHGKEILWYVNGQKSGEGNYINGKLDGKYTWWYENGLKMQDGNYKDGDLLIRAKYTYHPNGQKNYEENYKDDKKDGEWLWWHENGQKFIEGQYKDDKEDGEWFWWLDTGIEWKNKNFKDGVLVSETAHNYYYYDNGIIHGPKESKRNYKYGKEDGISTWWYENGQKFIEGNYKNGKLDGDWTFWTKNGQKDEERNYKDGDLVNKTIFKYSYFTGHLKSEKKYIDGKCISGC